MARDIYRAWDTYQRALKRLDTNPALPVKNRKIAYIWILSKEKELRGDITPQEDKKERIRYAKTLSKYCAMLTNVCRWFPDLKNVTEKELKKFKEDFYQDKIRSHTGKRIKSKSDYINKVIKSDFFKNYLNHSVIVSKVFNGRTRKDSPEPEFIELEDIRKLSERCSYQHQKVALWVLYSTGMRIGEFLNTKKKDYESKYNADTKIAYYLVHIHKDYTKSQQQRTVPIMIPECNELLQRYLETLANDDYIVDYKYSGINKMLSELALATKVKTKPNGKKVTLHTLRKSIAVYWLNNGMSLDQVKAMLGHKPSSTVIDVYVNYLGLEFKPEVSKIQTDALIELKKEVEDYKLQVVSLNQRYDNLKEELINYVDKKLTVKNKIP